MFDSIVIIRKLDDPTNEYVDSLARSVEGWAIENNISISHGGVNLAVKQRRLYVSIGGDGTFLYTARKSIQDPGSTVLGVNAGNLGFLVEEYTPFTLDCCLYKIMNGDSILDHRMTLTAQQQNKSFDAVNEIFLTANKFHSFQYNIFINNQLVASHVGSGVLVSTSTGSTAMSISSGGAIISPNTNVMQIVSLAPHTLTSRPIITSGRDEIRLEVVTGRGANLFQLIADGRCKTDFEASPSNSIVINSNQDKLSIWRKPDWDFFNVLKNKMNWGT